MEAVLSGRKIVSVSPKRQITIPKKFFQMLGFHTEAECLVRGNELVIRPARHESEEHAFSEQILAELVQQGLQGQELLRAFHDRQAAVRPAVDRMLEEARLVAEGKSAYGTMKDVFDEEEP